MTLFGLLFIATILTAVMFSSRQSMLGFPCAIFWAILGGYSYTQFTTAWIDYQYYVFFASLVGMVPFTIYAAWAMSKSDKSEIEQADEGFEEPEELEVENPRLARIRRKGAARRALHREFRDRE